MVPEKERKKYIYTHKKMVYLNSTENKYGYGLFLTEWKADQVEHYEGTIAGRTLYGEIFEQ